MNLNFLPLIWGPNAKCFLFGCCNHLRFFRLLIIFRRKLIFIDRVGFLPCLRSWLWRFQCCQKVQRLKLWFFLLRSWRRFTFLPSIWGPNAKCFLFGCCNHLRFFRLPIIFRRKLIFIDRVGFLPCLRSWLWHFQCCQMVQRLKLWFFLLVFLRIFTYFF